MYQMQEFCVQSQGTHTCRILGMKQSKPWRSKLTPGYALLLQTQYERPGGGGGASQCLERPRQQAHWLGRRLQFETLPLGFTLRLLIFSYLVV